MQLRQKILGDRTVADTVGTPNALYLSFRKQFELLLSKRSNKIPDFEQIYVEPHDYLDRLNEIRNENGDTFRFVLGHTGIGKSTLIKRCFKYENQSTFISNNQIIIPTLCDTTSIEKESVDPLLTSIVSATCQRIKRDLNIHASKDAILDMILSTKDRLLARPKQSLSATDHERLDLLFEQYPRIYHLEELKVLLNLSNLTDVIFILDDIESVHPWSHLIDLVNGFCVIDECLQNNPQRKYNCKLLIAARPDTFYSLEEAPSFNGRYRDHNLALRRMPELALIFDKRFQHINKHLNIDKITTGEWDTAYGILSDYCRNIEKKHHGLFGYLTNFNVRDSLNHFEEFLSNERYIEKREYVGYEDIKVSLEDALLDDSVVAIIKALSYGNGARYSDIDNRPFPNILKNSPDPAGDLHTLSIVAFLASNGDENIDVGWRFTDLDEFIARSVDIFTHTLESDLHKSLFKRRDYLVDRKVIFKKPGDNENQTRYALSPRGWMLWKLLQENSVLLEIYREDIYFDSRIFEMRATVNLRGARLFREILKWINHLADLEAKNIAWASQIGALRFYMDCFGGASMTQRLITGVTNSISNYFRKTVVPEDISDLLFQVENRVSALSGPLSKESINYET